jgi:hypothetical protein
LADHGFYNIPDVFHRIELGWIDRQKLNLNPPGSIIDKITDHPASVTPKSIPDTEKIPGHVAHEVRGKLDNLRTSHRSELI